MISESNTNSSRPVTLTVSANPHLRVKYERAFWDAFERAFGPTSAVLRSMLGKGALGDLEEVDTVRCGLRSLLGSQAEAVDDLASSILTSPHKWLRP